MTNRTTNAAPTRIIVQSVLPGEPLDGTGKVCIHLFVPDPHGPFTEGHVLYPIKDEMGQPIKGKVEAKPTRGRLACNPRRTVAPKVRGSVVTVTHRSDDPRAISCLKCKASVYYAAMMEQLKGT